MSVYVCRSFGCNNSVLEFRKVGETLQTHNGLVISKLDRWICPHCADQYDYPPPSEPQQVTCISLWQPWAQWVILGWKTIETRTHNRFRTLKGRTIYIHASARFDKNAIDLARDFLSHEKIRYTYELPDRGGQIIGSVKVDDFRVLGDKDSRAALIECRTLRYGLFLSRPIGITNYHTKGGQGIFYRPSASSL